MPKSRLLALLKKPEFNIAIGYVIMGILWILFSDHIIEGIARNKEELTVLQSYKGILYMFVSGAFVFFLARNEIKKREKIEQMMLIKEKELQMQIVQSEERERNRIAKDLHDGLQQKLAGLGMFAESLKPDSKFSEQLETIKSLIQESVQETRNISFNLNSSLIERKGLKESLKRMEKNISSLNEVKVYIECSFKEEDIPYILKNNVYRITQELITNTIKHANAKNIDLHLWKDKNLLKLSYSDDGIGLQKNYNSFSGQGLHNIKERVKMLSGEISIPEKPRGFSANIDFMLSNNYLEAV